MFKNLKIGMRLGLLKLQDWKLSLKIIGIKHFRSRMKPTGDIVLKNYWEECL